MKDLMGKLSWLKKHARVELSNMPPGPGRVVHITVYDNQDKRGYVVQKHRVISPGFIHHYFGWDKGKQHWKSGRGFGENQIDEAIAYAKERLSKQKFEIDPPQLKEEFWTVYEPGEHVKSSRTHYFRSFDKAEKFYNELYSKLEII